MNETGYVLTEMPRDTWVEVQIIFGFSDDKHYDPIAVASYFKFEVKAEDFPLGCPLIKINLQFYHGLSTLYVSNEVIPSPANFQV